MVIIKIHESFRTSYGRGAPISFPPDKDNDKSNTYYETIKRNIEEAGGSFETTYSGARTGGHGIDGYTGSGVIADVTAIIASLGGAAATLKVVGDVMVAWINNRTSRSVMIKVGDKQVEVKGRNDVDKALRLIESLGGDRHDGTPSPQSDSDPAQKS